MKTVKRISKANAVKWVNALRSGKFKQVQGALQSKITKGKTGYCCLGVVCKLAIPEDKLSYKYGLLEGSLPYSQENAPEWLHDLNIAFKELTGFSFDQLNDSGISPSHASSERLTSHDSYIQPLTFDEIADLIQLTYVEGALDGFDRLKFHADVNSEIYHGGVLESL